MTYRRIFIGDVHGHYNELMRLFEAMAPTQDDRIYFLGDLIDRGPQSAEVVDFVMSNRYHCLLGNHELMLLEALNNGELDEGRYQAWLYSGGMATVNSYEGEIPVEHIQWMEQLPLYLDLEDIWLVHAGVHPHLPIEKQTADDFCWIRDEFHSIQEPYFPDKLIITGHTITFTIPGVKPGKIASGPGWLNIETGVYHSHSGWLTALDMSQDLVYQVNSRTGGVRTMPLENAITKVKFGSIMSRWFKKIS